MIDAKILAKPAIPMEITFDEVSSRLNEGKVLQMTKKIIICSKQLWIELTQNFAALPRFSAKEAFPRTTSAIDEHWKYKKVK